MTKRVRIFGGLFELILWEPNDGVLFLKDKRVWLTHPKTNTEISEQGGALWITIFRREELKAHFPAKDHSFLWDSSDIMTREGVEVGVIVNIFWRIGSIEQFIFKLGDSIRIDNEKYVATLTGSAEQRIRSITESNIRTIFASKSFITLSPINVAKHLDGDAVNFIEMQPSNKKSEIEKEMLKEINDELAVYGIFLENLKIERTTLPDAITKKIEQIHTKALHPIEAQLDAQAAAIRAKQDADAIRQKKEAELGAYVATLGQTGALELLKAEATGDDALHGKKFSAQKLPSPEINLRISVNKNSDGVSDGEAQPLG